MTDRKPVILTTGDLRAYRVGLLHTHLETHPLVAMLDDLVKGRTLCVVKEPVAVVKNCHLGKVDWLDAALNEHGELKLKDDELLYRAQEK